MIIVNQDKDIIFNFENIDIIEIENPSEEDDDDDGMFEILAITTSDNKFLLGEYKTEERAKEVLQEIIKSFSFTELTGEPERLKLILEITKLGRYQMPEE